MVAWIAACAPATRATGTRKGKHDTYSVPKLWKKSVESGSSPSSPQIPSSRSPFVLQPSQAPIRASRPTPGVSRGALQRTVLLAENGAAVETA